MRISEVVTTHPVKPLSPQQSRIRALQQQIENGRRALAAERERQRRQRESERQRHTTNKLAN